ncbi:MAG: MBL fold metallo-hydrolase [Oscillospiraceae bacterium]|nr:MBL fold metallo-hydrolase [Oscillospiraceae bacterium]
MARLYPLFSSSSGNCTYIGSSNAGILIDDGVSFARLKKALEINGLSLSSVKAVFITHEHSDHIKGLDMLTKKISVPVFAQDSTLEYLLGKNMLHGEHYDIKQGVEICGYRVEPFATSHDTPQSCGYKITMSDGKTAAVCTDLGYVSEEVENALDGTSCVLLESNYDIEMLRNGPYPYYLKTRIFGNTGHLSNPDSGKFAARLIGSGTTHIILGHLSQHNNTPAIAEQTVVSCLDKFKRNSDYILSVAPVETAGGFVPF